MRDFDSLKFHPTAEQIVQVLCKKTQNDSPEFFRISLTYYLAKLAATMRVKIATKDRGEIPVNIYAINLASSGHGKGHSTNIIEEQLIHLFRSSFFNDVYPVVVERALSVIAAKRAVMSDKDEEEVLKEVQKEFEALGKLLFSFDSASGGPAIKQLRQQLLMSGIGAMNLEIDEVGNNLTANLDALGSYLELYDVGKIKQKLIKNSKENTRNEEIDGRTPANLLMFGTPSKLLDGDKTENEFYSLQDTGYARRSIFGYSKAYKKDKAITAEEIYDALIDPDVEAFIRDTAIQFGKLASITNHNKVIAVDKAVSILIIEYRMHCEKLAEDMGEHEEIARAEMSHRYFKALKLAGVYAFIDGHNNITKDNYYHAICMIEESGVAFTKILQREKPYVKLAKYLGSVGREVTLVDLSQDLLFFRGSAAVKQEQLQMAAAWGYSNNIVIKKSIANGIEFIRGETLKKANLDELHVSVSDDIADGYVNSTLRWDEVSRLTQMPHKHWINHYTTTGHRSEECTAKGFDMVVLDVDGGTPVETCMHLLKDYRFMIHTTKRHTTAVPRFRVIFPLNYYMELNPSDYRMFMKNIFEWIPFEIDAQTVDRCRKWLTHEGDFVYSKGELPLDARLFIPKTAKNEEQKTFIATYQSMTNMQRWFLTNSSNGNRNNQLLRYAMVLLDLGYDEQSIKGCVLEMNDKFPDKLTLKELSSTILQSVSRKILKQSTP